MTVHRRARAPEARATSVTSIRAPPPSARSRSTSQAGEQITVADLVKGGADPVGERRRRRARARDRARASPRSPQLMNAKAKQLGLTDSHFVRPDGLDAPGEYSSARDVTRLALAAMKIAPVARPPSTRRRRRSPAAARSTPGTTCSASSPGVFGVKTGHTDDGRLGPGRGGARRRHDDLRDDPRQPLARRSATPTSRRCSPTGSRSTGRSTPSTAGRAYASVDAAVRPRAAAARRALAAPRRRAGRAAAGRAGRRAGRRCRCRCGGARWSGASQVWSRGRLARLAAARRGALGRPQPGLTGRVGWYARRTVHHVADLLTSMIVTVTLNAAFARTITVPNFQRGQRHRASAGAPARRREGDQRRAGAEDARRPGRRHRASPAARPGSASSSA